MLPAYRAAYSCATSLLTDTTYILYSYFQVIWRWREPMDTGLLIARLVFGMVMAAHGAQKLFGWFGGVGLAKTGSLFDSLGFRPGRLLAAAAGTGETVSGVLLA